MLRDVVQRLLHDAVEVNRNLAVQFARRPRLLVVHFDPRLFLEAGQILIHRAFEADFVQDHGVQRVRESAHFFERGLYDLLHLAQVRAERVGGLQAPAGALQHGSHGGQNLAEIVVQVAGDGAEGAFLHGDQLLRQLAAAGRKGGHFLEQPAVVIAPGRGW